LRSKPGETAFSGFCASKTVLLTKPWRQPRNSPVLRKKPGETAFDFKNHGGQPEQTILRSKRGETVFSGFCASKTVPLTKTWRQPVK